MDAPSRGTQLVLPSFPLSSVACRKQLSDWFSSLGPPRGATLMEELPDLLVCKGRKFTRPGAPVSLGGTYRRCERESRGEYNMGPLSDHADPYYVYAVAGRGGLIHTFN
eukprot:761361-Hanusia_phi.AAC.2